MRIVPQHTFGRNETHPFKSSDFNITFRHIIGRVLVLAASFMMPIGPSYSPAFFLAPSGSLLRHISLLRRTYVPVILISISEGGRESEGIGGGLTTSILGGLIGFIVLMIVWRTKKSSKTDLSLDIVDSDSDAGNDIDSEIWQETSTLQT
jgi:hypothetical protein